MGRTGFHTGRTAVAMLTQITFQGLRLLQYSNYLHCTKRTGRHTTFTADTAALIDNNRAIVARNGVIRADPGARGIFAMMTGHGRRKRIGLNDANARDERRRR